MEICKETLCTGCGLCSAVCPRSAIVMKADREGFLRPSVDLEKCTSCSYCEKKCPQNAFEYQGPTAAYAAYSKDIDIRENSSSGGIFAHLAMAVIDDGGVVVGAGFDDSFRVVHKSVTELEQLSDLMGSKYVQSRVQGMYGLVGRYLSEGKRVLFSGTPCQCAAMRNIFGKREGLVLVDFICHGVPTPSLWEKFIGERFDKVINASFRNKERGWQEFSMMVETENDTYNVSQYKDPYLRIFLSNVALRPSCYECTFKGDEGYSSDITLADFWGISKIYPHMNDDNGTSAVIIRGDVGASLFERVKKDLCAVGADVAVISSTNAAYSKSANKPARREAFFADLENNMSFENISIKYGKPLSFGEIAKIRMKRSAKKLMGKVYRLKNR